VKHVRFRRMGLWWVAVLSLPAIWGCRQPQPAPPTPTAEHPAPYPGMAEARSRAVTLKFPRGAERDSPNAK